MSNNSLITAFTSVYKGTHTGPVLMTARESAKGPRLVNTTAHTGDLVANVNLTAIKREVPKTFRRVAPEIGKAVLVNVAATGIALEVVDMLENLYERRLRRDELHRVIQQVATHGPTDALNQQLLILSRADERRTFGQWVKDLPYRTGRRFARICLVEAGYWYMYLTSPLWVPAVLVDLAYSFVVVPVIQFVSKSVFKREVDIETLMKPRLWLTVPIIKHTVLKGWKVFSRGVDMRIYNRNATTSNVDAYPVFEAAKVFAHGQIKTIVDGRTAFAWGEALAEYVQQVESSVDGREKAYAQVSYWVEDNIVPEFRTAVLYGFRTGTPVIYRDMVSV